MIIKVEFAESSNVFEVDFSEMIPVEQEREHYSGDYEVIPKVTAQELSTKAKVMDDDVTIRAIPYYETSNLKGKTVYIGGHLDD